VISHTHVVIFSQSSLSLGVFRTKFIVKERIQMLTRQIILIGPLNAVREEEAQAAIATDAKAAASNAAEEVTSNVTAEVEDRADLEV